MINNIALVYFSPTDTTRRTVRAVARGVGLPLLWEYDCTLPEGRVPAPAFGPETLVLVGGPVYGGRMPKLWGEWLRGLRGDGTPAVILPVYGNRDFDDAAVELEDLLTERGFAVVGCGAFVGEHSFNEKIAAGRPNKEDLQEAEAFGAAVMAKLKSGGTALKKGVIPGNRPMKPLGPPTNKKPTVAPHCLSCSICTNGCPTGAIDSLQQIDETKCIMCRNCAKNCPVGAIEFGPETGFPEISKGCMERFGTPDKKNQTWL